MPIKWVTATAGSLIVVALAAWSEVLVIVAPALRVPLPPLAGDGARAIHSYRRLCVPPVPSGSRCGGDSPRFSRVFIAST